MALTFIPQRSRSTLVQAERDALEVLYDAYDESLYNSVFRKMVALGYSRERSRELTGEIIQEVWADVWKNRQSLKTASFQAYLRGEVRKRVLRQGAAEEYADVVYDNLDTFLKERGVDIDKHIVVGHKANIIFSKTHSGPPVQKVG
jgi:DNA-directed RNA polymerase specialized sigma24 family protein